MRGPVALDPHQHLIVSPVFIRATMWWYNIMVLICVFLKSYNMQHLFLYLLAIWISFCENVICLSQLPVTVTKYLK